MDGAVLSPSVTPGLTGAPHRRADLARRAATGRARGSGLAHATQRRRYALHLHRVAAWPVAARACSAAGSSRPGGVRSSRRVSVPTRGGSRRTGSGASCNAATRRVARAGVRLSARRHRLARRAARAARSRRAAARCGFTRRSAPSRPAARTCSVEVDGSRAPLRQRSSLTLPPGELADSWRPARARELPNLDVPHQGRVTALVILQRRLGGLLPDGVPRQDAPFQRHRGDPRRCPRESPGGRHLIYVRNECGPHTDAFKLPERRRAQSRRSRPAPLVPGFDPRDVEAVHVSHNGAGRADHLVREPAPADSDPHSEHAGVPVHTSAQASSAPRGLGHGRHARARDRRRSRRSQRLGRREPPERAAPKEDRCPPCPKSLAIVGPGRRRADWLECAAELPELALAAGVDPNPARRAETERAASTAFASVNELLAVAGAPHVAILCTPPALPARARRAAARAGVDLLIEPPLADRARRRGPDRRAGRAHRPRGA